MANILNIVSICLGLAIIYYSMCPPKREVIDFKIMVNKYNWKSSPSIAQIFDGAYIDISTLPGQYKTLSLQHNEVDKYYLYIREGEENNRRDKDDLVLLRNDLRYIDDVEKIYNYLTDKNFKDGKSRISKNRK